ncbi:chemotaxis protein CheW [Halobacteriovorax sp. HLS]|uniref:hybrid sensor histidine kinase/response regulator n=1 Tax=Halobacteriovorax sp. HLS TaxID=2234000 RepID=UPI000FDCDCCA|nr:chemotaxis protein CheW [Halobacteriovorax sp. HLS]
MTEQNAAIIHEFLIESFENLSGISEEITQYEKDHSNSELLNSIYRKVHTLKGSSSFLSFKILESVTHHAENILDMIREGEMEMDSDIIDILLETFDACLEMLKNIEANGTEGENKYSDLNARLLKVESNESIDDGLRKKFEEQKISETSDLPALNIKLEVMNETKLQNKSSSEELALVTQNQNASESVKTEVVKLATEDVLEKKPEVKKAETKKVDLKTEEPKKVISLTDSVVRVNVQLLDKIMNVVGELVLNRNQILQYANISDSPDLTRLAQQLNVITTDLQTDIMTTRMQPVGTVLTKFERIVRDLSREQGKSIKLTISGKETELDKTLLEAIRDPMTHLVRNSVDHGIEDSSRRLENGKSEDGHIHIKSYHEGGQVTIEISDDGNGINPEVILAKAISKNLVSKEKGATLSERQILNLIFTPGFSTAEQVTNISGRGVGMDVVKSNIEKIGGSVDVHSVVGNGTTFKLKIPLTLAIVPALVVRSSGETFAIPQINLVELVRIENEGNENHIEKLLESEFFRLRGELIPVFRLGESLKLLDKDEVVEDINEDCVNIVILNAEGQFYGLIVDHVLDTEEIVVKPLSRKLKDLNLFGGATIMGDGSVALIVDALGFFNSVDSGASARTDEHDFLEEKEQIKNGETQEILLTQLGDSRDYGIPLCLVNRLEEFPLKDIEWTGDQPLVRYGNQPMLLINLEECLELEGTSSLLSEEKDITVACIVTKVRGSYFGLVVKEIKDIAFSESDVNEEMSDRDGIMGTIFINGKTVSLLDVHKVIDSKKRSKNIASNNLSVLLVDDSPLHQRVQKEIITELGYCVTTACDGVDGMQKFSEMPDLKLIVTDIEMPNLNGWEFIKKVRETNPNIPVIGISSRITSKDEERGERNGFNCFIDKSNQEKMTEAILNCVG